MAYTLKMSHKTDHRIEGFFEYVVPPLEGFWRQAGADGFDAKRKADFEWISVIYKTNIRAIADISLGTTCYELARRLREQTFSERKRWLLTGIGFVTYGSAFVYICSNRSSTYGGIICLLLCIAVTISFSESGYFVHHQWFQNKFCMFLGSISLPMYLMQDVFRRLVPYCAAGSSKKVKALLIFFGTLVSAIVVKAIISFCAGRYLKKRTDRTDQAEKA